MLSIVALPEVSVSIRSAGLPDSIDMAPRRWSSRDLVAAEEEKVAEIHCCEPGLRTSSAP